MAKLILNEAQAEQYLAEPSIESNEKYELSEELLKELRSNSYRGRVEEDVVGHIATILEILNPIEVDISMTDKYFVEYTGIEVKHFKDTLLQLMGNVKKCVAERPHADLVVTESSGTKSEVQDDISMLGNDTDADDADIRPIYDEEPMAEVQLTAEWQHGQILNETSNKAKIKKEIEAFETINMELEHSVAKLLTENENLNRENKTLKNPYKDLYDSIKITRSKTIEQTTSLLANNVDLKAQIQEKRIRFAKPDHMIASSESRNSSKNLPRFSSNDMVHNHYLDEARKKTQERDRNSKTSVTPSAKFQITTDVSKQRRRNNQTPRSLPVSKSSCVTIKVMPKADHSKSSSSFSDSKHFVCSTCHKCVFNANHDACITKLLKEVNSHAKIQSHKTRNSNKPVDQKSHTQKTGRQIFTGHRFSPNKTFTVYEKTSPRSDLSEPPHGSNVDIPNIHECKQTLDVSAGTPIKVQKKQSLDLSIEVHQAAETVTTSNELDLLFGPLFDEYFNGENQVVLKSSAVTTTDASNKRQQQPDSTSSTSTLATTVTANGNFDL
ncbi:hypothetical protein Tco_0875854 [Tanacetum coccineum]|uniref:Uncharacterized protein n=1 Tax=Tanacetum coccineum TaxID=301880 RepID=A0ABQ5BU45_9ASTR